MGKLSTSIVRLTDGKNFDCFILGYVAVTFNFNAQAEAIKFGKYKRIEIVIHVKLTLK